MWFITEILTGVLALTAIVILAYQNRALHKLLHECQRELASKETMGTALAIAQLAQAVQVSTQSQNNGKAP